MGQLGKLLLNMFSTVYKESLISAVLSRLCNTLLELKGPGSSYGCLLFLQGT